MNPRRFFGRIEHFDVAMRAAIDQRRIAEQRLSATADFEQLGQLAEVPRREIFVERGTRRCRLRPAGRHASARIRRRRQRRARRELLKMLLRLPAEFRAQLREVASHRELPAVLVDDLEVHEQMCRQRLELEVGAASSRFASARGHRRSAPRASRPRRTRTAVPIDETRREFRQRHDMTTQLLRQRLQQQLRLFLQHAGHEPFGSGAHRPGSGRRAAR